MVFHTSRWHFWYGYFVIFLAVIFGIWSLDSGFDAFSLVCFIVAGVFLLVFELLVWLHRFRFSDNEFYLSVGILSIKTTRAYYSSVADVTVDQSLLGRVFGYGDVHINTTGSDAPEIVLRCFASARKIEKVLSERIRKHRVVSK